MSFSLEYLPRMLSTMVEAFGEKVILKEVSVLEKEGALFVEDGNHGEYRPLADEFVEEGVPFVRPPNLVNGRIDLDQCQKINDKAFKRVRKGIGKGGDIVLTHNATVGRVAITKDDDPVFVTNPQTTVWRSENRDIIDPQYLYYFMKSSGFQEQLESHKGRNATFDYVSLTKQRSLVIPVLDIDLQRFIGGRLACVDDKIELNRQTNQTLEHIAQAIFKSWFVDFEPTRAKIAAKQIAQARQDSARSAALKAALFADGRWPEAVAAAIAEGDPERAAMAAISGKTLGEIDQLDVQGRTNAAGAGSAGAASPEQQTQLLTTAALFPDALVDSELGEIPEGWDVKGIKELSSKISKGTTPRKADIQKAEDAETIPFLKVRDISNDGEITRVGLDKIPESIHSGTLKRSMLEANDLLFSIAGTIGRVALVEEDLSISNCNQAIAFVRLKESEKYLELCRLNLVGSRVQDEVISKVVQGVQANFSLTGLGEIKVLIPSEDLLASFNKTVGDMGNKQRLLLSENRKLAELRDALLPKLLSGELELTSKGAA